MRSLLDSITGYLNKSALRPVFDKLRLMVSYLNDVYRGYYTDYSIKHYVIVIAAIIYVIVSHGRDTRSAAGCRPLPTMLR